jgi:hypothetical protein
LKFQNFHVNVVWGFFRATIEKTSPCFPNLHERDRLKRRMHHSIAIDLSEQKERRAALCASSIWGRRVASGPLRWPVPVLSCVPRVVLICTLFRWLLHGPYNVCLCRFKYKKSWAYIPVSYSGVTGDIEIGRNDLDPCVCVDEENCIRNIPQQ